MDISENILSKKKTFPNEKLIQLTILKNARYFFNTPCSMFKIKWKAVYV